jgi:hypothetical protein
MTYFYSFFASVILLFSQINEVPYAELETAFANSDATSIVSFGKEKMLISILDKEGAFSQAQATLILKDFFAKKPVSSFKITFKGKEKGNGTFAIGTYTSKNENFRVTIYLKSVNGDYKIERMTVEQE